MNISAKTKELLKKSSDLIDEERFKELLLLVPYEERKEVFQLLHECGANIDTMILSQLKGLHPTATKRETKLYNKAIELGFVDKNIKFTGTSGFSLSYKSSNPSHQSYDITVKENKRELFDVYVYAYSEDWGGSNTLNYYYVDQALEKITQSMCLSIVLAQ